MSAAELGIYVHWPYCARICPYCDFNVVRDRRQPEQASLAAAILTDLASQRALTGERSLVSIFLGGGTPSLMDPAWAAQIIETARALWTPTDDLEITLEANPTDAETARFAAFAAAGVNRLSLGLQALDDQALRFLGRDHDAGQGLRAVKAARVFPRLSLDAIYALPHQTPHAWTEALRRIVDLGPEHISPYQLTIEPGTAFGRAVARGAWSTPDEAMGEALYAATQDTLEAEGFEAYEVSNHARGEAARSRHNLVYWRGVDYVGVGPGAHGRIRQADTRRATEAERKPGDYIARVGETGLGFASVEALDPAQIAEERLLSGLRIKDGVAFAELSALGLTPAAVLPFIELGLVAEDPERLRATPAGRLVLDRLTFELAQAGTPPR
ncbi:radical SAM family heme chaperone HemW [Phenylobacterium immobile]|uniref:radical SAM family heme chaperone HemW n=1 Tax=Phenylobacterium immobile TaxID=21 RepID=UPI000B040312|nr:radical SAM family heme chaperone HemW [Phenylobacterium immobile]